MGWRTGTAALALSLTLGGCIATSVRGLRDKPPVLVADSQRPMAEIAQCISDTWVKLGFTPRMLPRENGTSLVVEQVVTYAIPVMVVDMDFVAPGTHVTMREFKTFSPEQNRKRVEEVRACL